MFGNRKTVNGWPSFEEHTGGRATLTTTLGPRRKVGDKPPSPRARRLAVIHWRRIAGGPSSGATCASPRCARLAGSCRSARHATPSSLARRGLDCVAAAATPTDYVCKPYCDPLSTTSAAACNTLCPRKYQTYQDSQGVELGSLCFPSRARAPRRTVTPNAGQNAASPEARSSDRGRPRGAVRRSRRRRHGDREGRRSDRSRRCEVITNQPRGITPPARTSLVGLVSGMERAFAHGNR